MHLPLAAYVLYGLASAHMSYDQIIERRLYDEFKPFMGIAKYNTISCSNYLGSSKNILV